jgi:D-tyrosyl-tRNA(Tyr) deacylase
MVSFFQSFDVSHIRLVQGQNVGSIGPGLAVLIGIHQDDQEEDADYIVKKILNLKLFAASDDEGRMWSQSVMSKELGVLCISQFTLFAITSKGNKPDMHLAMKPDLARIFYDKFFEKMTKAYRADKIATGRFGERMHIHLENDGPVTVIVDSKQR